MQVYACIAKGMEDTWIGGAGSAWVVWQSVRAPARQRVSEMRSMRDQVHLSLNQPVRFGEVEQFGRQRR